MGCLRFLDDSRLLLVEAACGATMVTAYNGRLDDTSEELNG